jgi:hypothetical protein
MTICTSGKVITPRHAKTRIRRTPIDGPRRMTARASSMASASEYAIFTTATADRSASVWYAALNACRRPLGQAQSTPTQDPTIREYCRVER